MTWNPRDVLPKSPRGKKPPLRRPREDEHEATAGGLPEVEHVPRATPARAQAWILEEEADDAMLPFFQQEHARMLAMDGIVPEQEWERWRRWMLRGIEPL